MSAVRRAAIVGSGYMGTGFAQLLALGGIDVVMSDASGDHARAARERAISLARRFEAMDLMAPGSGDAVAARTRSADSIAEAAADADVIFEAVSEDVGVKRDVLAAVEDVARPDAIITTNTSAIPIRTLAARLRTPERFVGTHWFNPAQWVPAVEVIPGEATRDAVVDTIVALLRAIGKDPVVVGDGPGFVANRIQFAMFREAAMLVEEGIASAADVDRVVRSSFGFRLPFYGPFTIADMAGLDVYAGAYATLEQEFGPRFSAPPSLTRLVADGQLGTKAGGGYLMSESNGSDALEEQRDRLYVSLQHTRDSLDAPER